jgi:thiosulfate/3-mercaptopyruvate sulfurtransferase
MKDKRLPLIVEPDVLEKNLGETDLLIVDLCKQDTYTQYHIPGAVHLEYSQIISAQKPIMGILPDDAQISQTLSSIGLDTNTHVVAYDDEGGGKACRLLWTLDVLGHDHFSLLNGGLHAWANENHPMNNDSVTITPTQYELKRSTQRIADKKHILDHMKETNTRLLDARTPEEFTGIKKYAERGGHIPNAINMDWMLTMDQNRNLRLKSDQEIQQILEERNIKPDNEVIVYCQTHHRSSHTYIALKHLGYENLRGYPGAWSEWGNDPDLPLET